MTFQELKTDPVVIAVFSAFLGVILTYVATIIYDKVKASKKRKSGFKLLREELINHKNKLEKVAKDTKLDQIHPRFSTFPIHNILNSGIVDTKKDREVLLLLYTHLDNIETINQALDFVSNKVFGSILSTTSVKENAAKDLTQEIMTEMDQCIKALEDKI